MANGNVQRKLTIAINSLSYMGVNASAPPNSVLFMNQDPTPTDWQNVIVGDIWINENGPTNPPTPKIWILGALARHSATWILLSSGGSGPILDIVTDNGTAVPVAGVIGLFAQPSVPRAGASVSFSVASVNNILLNTTDSNRNTLIGLDAGNGSISGNTNSGLGYFVLNGLTSGTGNCGLGGSAGLLISSGANNILLGGGAASNLVSGNQNIILGINSGTAYTSNESSNILINNTGTISESNVMRLGTTGSGSGQVNTTYIAGAYGVSVGGTNQLMIMDNTGKVGTTGVSGGISTGTFTPTLTFSTSTGTITYTSQAGKYTHIGNVVYFIASVFVTSIGTSSGNASLAGLPVTVASVSNLSQDVSMSINSVTLTANYTETWALCIGGTTTAQFQQGGSGQASAGITDSGLGGSFGITCYGFYFSS